MDDHQELNKKGGRRENQDNVKVESDTRCRSSTSAGTAPQQTNTEKANTVIKGPERECEET